MLGRIYGFAAVHTRFQLSRVSTLCLGLWRQDLRNNVVNLLTHNLKDSLWTDDETCELKLARPWISKTQLSCWTLHVRLDKAGLGQFLSLPENEQRTAGLQFTSRLVLELSCVQEFVPEYLLVWVRHNAKLKHGDMVALSELLWSFPSRMNEIANGLFILDTQWWLSPCARSAPRVGVSWDCFEKLVKDGNPDQEPALLCLDSTRVFKD